MKDQPEFWSRVSPRYDRVVDLQIGPDGFNIHGNFHFIDAQDSVKVARDEARTSRSRLHVHKQKPAQEHYRTRQHGCIVSGYPHILVQRALDQIADTIDPRPEMGQ